MKISVVIPVYNAEKYVQQAVESALQFSEVSEVILIEDKSPDNALEVCRILAEKYDKVKFIQHPDKENHGAGPSRNLGIENATGDFITFLDADDYYLPNRFDAEKILFQNPEVEGVYGGLGVHYYSQKAKQQYYTVFADRLSTVYKEHHPKEVFPGLTHMRGSFGIITLNALTIRKSSLLNKMNILFKPLRFHEDTEFLFRLSYYLHLYPGILNQPIAMRGVHEDNRITDIETKKIKPSITRVLLWNEVYNWAHQEKKMPEDFKIHIKRMYLSFEIANSSFFKKMSMLTKFALKDSKIISKGIYNINFRPF
ncbi:glycosyltransferase family 2 protein [Chryseobacterium nematophagum]|uniref:Glycosyltransferase family 2 protein n=1 Tax=Chryseobacterium nematophagum TaxID=2305228 RepID=A0A3M7LE88_9FLAO|nr:glycosyltransferase family 2 protein [Chryseobacterium nematophagum]RMZ61041.1 glycosyltransferase family 2 protein [Chryseobacterium nematophagum]